MDAGAVMAEGREQGEHRRRTDIPKPWWRVVSINSLIQTGALVTLVASVIYYAAGQENDIERFGALAVTTAEENRATREEVRELAQNQVRILQMLEASTDNNARTGEYLDRVAATLADTRDRVLIIEGARGRTP